MKLLGGRYRCLVTKPQHNALWTWGSSAAALSRLPVAPTGPIRAWGWVPPPSRSRRSEIPPKEVSTNPAQRQPQARVTSRKKIQEYLTTTTAPRGLTGLQKSPPRHVAGAHLPPHRLLT